MGRRITVQLDATQAAWLEAIAEVNGLTRAAVLREALAWLAAKESARVQRNARLDQLQALREAGLSSAASGPARYRRTARCGRRGRAR